jgi:3-oxoacyl-[acyl-carrier-protein] synthase III
MKIAGVGMRLPSRVVRNDDILDMIRSSGHGLSREDEALYLERTMRVLLHSGADTRNWLAEGESPWEIVRGSVHDALQDAGLPLDDVDVYIYASVSRGFLEPAEAYAVALGAGMKPKHCFDVIEACNSFSRAAQLAQLMLDSGQAKNVVITVAEFCVNGSDYVLPNFKPNFVDDLAWRFPSYTLGELAATVVLTGGAREWRFRTHTDVSLAPACVVALPHGPFYGPEMNLRDRGNTEIFRSFGQPMHAAAVEVSAMLWKQLLADSPRDVSDAPILFPHAPSRKLCEDFSANTGYPMERIFQLYTRFGNIGSASVPAGVFVAREEGRLKRGDTVLCMVGAAGMSFMLYDFTF